MNVFAKALRVLDGRGWYQGGLRGPNGGVCIIGALLDAGAEWGVVDSLMPGELIDGDPHPLAVWNDDPHTTEEDVRLLLKQAAYDWDEAHALS